MSYYGIRKQKFIQTNEGLWNITCELYDSSLRDYDGKRIWKKYELLYNTSYNTREELEYQFFCDVVDGNMIKVVAWYDNEWGYSNRLVELAVDFGKEA